jgi:hypothetical protein
MCLTHEADGHAAAGEVAIAQTASQRIVAHVCDAASGAIKRTITCHHGDAAIQARDGETIVLQAPNFRRLDMRKHAVDLKTGLPVARAFDLDTLKQRARDEMRRKFDSVVFNALTSPDVADVLAFRADAIATFNALAKAIDGADSPGLLDAIQWPTKG